VLSQIKVIKKERKKLQENLKIANLKQKMKMKMKIALMILFASLHCATSQTTGFYFIGSSKVINN
jgi:hypothetical protein